MVLKLVIPPTEYPITLDEAKAHLRVDGNDEDSLITGLIGAATEHVQSVTNRQLMDARYDYRLHCLPACIKLPRPPFVSVQSITAKDEEGQLVAFTEDDYTIEESEPAVIIGSSEEGSIWFEQRYTDISILYNTGYENTETGVPNAIKQAMLLIIGHLYTNREEVIVGTINAVNSFASNALLAPYRIFNI